MLLFTLLVHCIFYDIYFYSSAFFSSWEEHESLCFLFFFEPERFILLSAEKKGVQQKRFMSKCDFSLEGTSKNTDLY